MVKKYFPLLIFISALLISICGSFFSIYGLGKFYGGHWLGVTILAFSIELGNIIIATSLKYYWKYLPWVLKIPLMLCSIILITITSWGIYNYLSDGYQRAAIEDEKVQKYTTLVSTKKQTFESRLNENKKEIESINLSLEDLSKGYNQNTQTQQVIKGQVVTNVIVGNKKGLEQQMNVLNTRKNKLDSLNLSYLDSIQKLEIKIIETENSSDVTSELAPLKYLAELLNQPMNKVVNVLTLLIVIVTQPLALMLILTSMFAFKNNHYLNRGSKRKSKISEHKGVNFKDWLMKLFPPTYVVPIVELKEVQVRPKRKYNRKPKQELEIPVEIEQPVEEILEEVKPKPKKVRSQKRKVVDNNLTPDLAEHIAQSLKKNKLSHEQRRIMSQDQIDKFEKENK